MISLCDALRINQHSLLFNFTQLRLLSLIELCVICMNLHTPSILLFILTELPVQIIIKFKVKCSMHADDVQIGDGDFYVCKWIDKYVREQ